MLSKRAFNAMLKTLEEPPAHVKFILATTDPQKVPVTVLSRCLQFNLRQMASPSITGHLQNILTQENIGYEPTALHLIARAAAGSMRDALSLTDQAIAYGGQTVNEAEVRAMLGAVDQSYLYQLLDALLANDGNAIMASAKRMQERSLSFEAALNDLTQLLHQIAVAQAVPDSIADDLPERAILLNLASKIPAETLQLYYQIALLGKRDIALAPDEFAGFTMSLLRMLAFTPNEAGSTSNKSLVKPSNTTTAINTNAVEARAIVSTPVANIPETPVVKPSEPASEPVTTASPAMEPATDSTQTDAATKDFNGDWRALVNDLKLGLAKALAQQCELMAYDEHSISLSVPESQKHLLSPNYQEKLNTAITQYFGKKIRLQFSIGGTGNTPAKQMSEERAHAQANAETAIEEDSFVQALINDFGAQIIPNSIKPL
jgi:DNA polymerase-3 subunit gamma/tau